MHSHATMRQFGRFLLFNRLIYTYVLAIFLLAGQAVAANLAGDISGDSEITMTSESEMGSLSVNMLTALGSTAITINRNGNVITADMPIEEVRDLWDFVLERNAGALIDASPTELFTDQASITFTFRNGLESHSFSAYGVDFIADARYLEITTAVMDVVKRYESSAGQSGE
jgi:hypothetical protein